MSKRSAVLFSRHWSFWPAEIGDPLIVTARSKRFDYLFFAVMFLFSAVLNVSFIQNQLWQDELYTLKNFVLVPFHTTLTDYHSTNNHILSNLVMSAFLKIAGADFQTVLVHPEILRVVPYTFTLMSVAGFYFLSRKVFGSVFANVALVIFCTNLQLYTFGAQVRGYALEILLCTIHLLMILRFVQTRATPLLYWIGGLGTLMLVNLPSTVYYYGAIALIVLAGIPLNEKWKDLLRSYNVHLLFSMGSGFLLFAIYFLLFINRGQLTGNPLLYGTGSSFLSLIKLPFSILFRIADWRLYLIIPVSISLLLWRKSINPPRLSVFLVLSFFVPFILFAIHDPEKVNRIWIVVLPLFSIMIAHFCLPVLNYMHKHIWMFVTLNIVILLCSFFFLRKRLLDNNNENKITLDLRYQYHLYGYNPRTVLEAAVKEAGSSKARVKICEGFPAGISYYIPGFNIDSINAANKNSNQFVFITNDTNCVNNQKRIAMQRVTDGKNEGKFYKWYIFK